LRHPTPSPDLLLPPTASSSLGDQKASINPLARREAIDLHYIIFSGTIPFPWTSIMYLGDREPPLIGIPTAPWAILFSFQPHVSPAWALFLFTGFLL
jgi:hypothetical protein